MALSELSEHIIVNVAKLTQPVVVKIILMLSDEPQARTALYHSLPYNNTYCGEALKWLEHMEFIEGGERRNEPLRLTEAGQTVSNWYQEGWMLAVDMEA